MSSSPLLEAWQKAAVQRAALHIQDAWSGRERIHPREGQWLRKCWLLHLGLFYPTKVAIWLLIALSLFERPSWVITRLGEQPINTTLYPTSELPMLPGVADFTVEMPLLLLLAMDGAALAVAQGIQIIQRRRTMLYLLVLTLALCEAGLTATSDVTFRLAPFLRLGLLVLQSDALLQQFDLISRTVPQVAGVFLVLIAFVAVYSWAGALIFEGTPGFQGYGEAAWSLFICLTTANFPDVMTAQYHSSRTAIFFFAPFLLVGNFFLLNLVLAVVVNAHADSGAHVTALAQAAQQRSLRAAFALLANGRSTLTRETVLAVFAELNYYRAIAHIGEQRAQLLFATLDRSGDSAVDEHEFLSLCELLRIRFERVPRKTWFEVLAPRFASSAAWQRVCGLVRSRRFDFGVDALLVLAGILLVIEERSIFSGGPEDFDDRPDSLWNILELVFSTLFLIEMAVKLAALGWTDYTRSLKNTFDATVTVATTVIAAVVYFPNEISDSRYIRFVLLMRLLRLLRLLSWSPHVRFVSSTFLAVLPDARRLLLMLFCLLYFFSALGLQLYGGKINRDPTQPEFAILANTTFASADYFDNNFNDLASGFVTCFELLLVNNWFVLCEGFVAVTSIWSRLFFVAFFASGPLVCLNIAVAFCIEAFLAFMQETDGKDEEATACASDEGCLDGSIDGASTASMNGKQRERRPPGLLVDASEVSGTRTGISGIFRATFHGPNPRGGGSGGAGAGRRNSQLHRLFQRSTSTSLRANSGPNQGQTSMQCSTGGNDVGAACETDAERQ